METNTYHIILEPDKVIGDIQFQFNSLYPFLKIEFSKINGSSTSKKVNPNSVYCLKDFSALSSAVILNVDKNRTIKQIVMDCKDKLDLCMHVFRKSGNVWNVISLTDSWTLESQNNAGQFISYEMTGEPTLPVKVA